MTKEEIVCALEAYPTDLEAVPKAAEGERKFRTALALAIKALEVADKYKWHDLRKDPEDLPPINPKNTYENDVFLVIEDNKGEREIYKGHLKSIETKDEWDRSGKQNFFGLPTYQSNWDVWGWSYYRSFKVIAWRYIEPFEEDKE